ncbi:MAG TPA: hypothetical protein VFA59_08900 [Vicinamibacterales bacterium]|nr:hypothetical protein [Vicinamibacterales bacterium]
MTRRRWALIGAALYAVFLLTTAFTHHDLDCELKNPQHCTACTSSVLGADTHPPATLAAHQLVDAGSAYAELQTPHDLLLAVRSTGRSPPVSL